MLKQVKKWFELVEQVETNLSDWGVESVTLSKEELDKELIIEVYWKLLGDELDVDYYYYSNDEAYYIVYCLPLLTKERYLLGLLKENQLEGHTVIRVKSQGECQ